MFTKNKKSLKPLMSDELWMEIMKDEIIQDNQIVEEDISFIEYICDFLGDDYNIETMEKLDPLLEVIHGNEVLEQKVCDFIIRNSEMEKSSRCDALLSELNSIINDDNYSNDSEIEEVVGEIIEEEPVMIDVEENKEEENKKEENKSDEIISSQEEENKLDSELEFYEKKIKAVEELDFIGYNSNDIFEKTTADIMTKSSDSKLKLKNLYSKYLDMKKQIKELRLYIESLLSQKEELLKDDRLNYFDIEKKYGINKEIEKTRFELDILQRKVRILEEKQIEEKAKKEYVDLYSNLLDQRDFLEGVTYPTLTQEEIKVLYISGVWNDPDKMKNVIEYKDKEEHVLK